MATNSPAARAGIRAATRQRTVGGDVIVAIDGKPVDSSSRLADTVAVHKPGDRLRLEVERGGTSRVVHVTVGTAPQPA